MSYRSLNCIKMWVTWACFVSNHPMLLKIQIHSMHKQHSWHDFFSKHSSSSKNVLHSRWRNYCFWPMIVDIISNFAPAMMCAAKQDSCGRSIPGFIYCHNFFIWTQISTKLSRNDPESLKCMWNAFFVSLFWKLRIFLALKDVLIWAPFRCP